MNESLWVFFEIFHGNHFCGLLESICFQGFSIVRPNHILALINEQRLRINALFFHMFLNFHDQIDADQVNLLDNLLKRVYFFESFDSTCRFWSLFFDNFLITETQRDIFDPLSLLVTNQWYQFVFDIHILDLPHKFKPRISQRFAQFSAQHSYVLNGDLAECFTQVALWNHGLTVWLVVGASYLGNCLVD